MRLVHFLRTIYKTVCEEYLDIDNPHGQTLAIGMLLDLYKCLGQAQHARCF